MKSKFGQKSHFYKVSTYHDNFDKVLTRQAGSMASMLTHDLRRIFFSAILGVFTQIRLLANALSNLTKKGTTLLASLLLHVLDCALNRHQSRVLRVESTLVDKRGRRHMCLCVSTIEIPIVSSKFDFYEIQFSIFAWNKSTCTDKSNGWYEHFASFASFAFFGANGTCGACEAREARGDRGVIGASDSSDASKRNVRLASSKSCR